MPHRGTMRNGEIRGGKDTLGDGRAGTQGSGGNKRREKEKWGGYQTGGEKRSPRGEETKKSHLTQWPEGRKLRNAGSWRAALCHPWVFTSESGVNGRNRGKRTPKKFSRRKNFEGGDLVAKKGTKERRSDSTPLKTLRNPGWRIEGSWVESDRS